MTRRKYDTTTPVKLRLRALKNGGYTLSLESRVNGVRIWEGLKLRLIPERSRADKERNAETLRLAKAIQAQRVLDMQAQRFGLRGRRPRIQLTAYVPLCVARGASSTLLYHLRRFDKYGIAVEDVTERYCRDFIDYLNTTHKRYRPGVPLSGTQKRHQVVRLSAVLNKAVKEGYLPRNYIKNLPPSEIPSCDTKRREYLNIDEVGRLIETPVAPKREKVLNMFLFCCFCGLRYCDASALRWADIVTTPGGAKQIEIRQQKTAEEVYIPLSANALRFIPDRPAGASDTDFVYKVPKHDTVLRWLREWSRAAGINKRVTFHTSRHTFATLALTYGADLYTVSKLLGHTDIKTTQIYAEIIDAKKKQAVNLIPTL